MLLKKEIYNAKIKSIEDIITDITNLTTNTTLNAKTNEVENEIPNIINLATTAALNAKINAVENKIPNITNFATITTALTTDENEIPDHNKYTTTREFNKLTTEHFASRLPQANLTKPSKMLLLIL